MSFFNILNKKRVPSELPALSLNDSLPQSQEKVVAQPQVPKVQSYPPLPLSPQVPIVRTPVQAPKNLVAIPLQPQLVTTQDTHAAAYEKSRAIVEEERSFFKDLLKNVTQETKNIEKLEEWYENKFASEDIVHQMKNYWEDQKPQVMINSLGKGLKDRMLQKTEMLHKLEKEWQESYSTLLIKEEEIRAQEKELKEILAEFLTMCKKHMGKESKKSSLRSKDK